MPTEFGKKVRKVTKKSAKKPAAATDATKRKAKKLGLKLTRAKPKGKGRSALSEKTLKRLIKNRERKLKAEKKTKKKGRSRYGSSLVSASSGYSNGDFSLSGCPSGAAEGGVCGPGVTTYSDHLTTSYPGTYVDPIAYASGTAPDSANTWSANTPAHSANWPTSEGFRSAYGKLLKRRAQIIKRLDALSR